MKPTPKPNIILQKQPTPVTCVHACIAMALGVPVDQVIERYGPAAMNGQKLAYALTECRLIWNQLIHGTPPATGWYFATVPSLNIPGGNHQIIFHYDLDYGCDGFTILDPSTRKTYDSDGSNLLSWTELILFQPGGYLPA